MLKVLRPYLSEMSLSEAHLSAKSYWHLDLEGRLLIDNDRDPVMARFDGAMARAAEGLRFEDPVAFVRSSVEALERAARERARPMAPELASDTNIRDARAAFVTLLWAAHSGDQEARAVQRAYLANWRQQAQRYVVAQPGIQFSAARSVACLS
jgi:hypothetical protein